MNPFELLADSEEQAVRAWKARQSSVWTAIPGIVQAFDPASMTCTVQPAIKAVLFAQDGTASDVALPLLLDCPAQFPSGGGYSLTFPVAEGDECLVVFASRCIDAWFASGGVQPQAELRMHDLSDGFVLLGFRSLPRVLSNLNASGVELRSDDGTTKVGVDSGQIVKITAPGGCNINGLVIDSSGNLTTPGNVSDSVRSMAQDRAIYDGHTHGGVTSGGSSTAIPNQQE